MFIRQKKIDNSSYSPIVEGAPTSLESSAYDDFFSTSNFGKDITTNWEYSSKPAQITKVEEGTYELKVTYKNEEYKNAKGATKPYTVYLTNSSASLKEETVEETGTKTLSSIAITTQPSKKEYTEGDLFDTTGLVVTATYSDGTTANVTSSCVVNNGQPLTEGQFSVEVKYTEAGVTKTITISNLSVFCFVQGTQVETEFGLMSIENVRTGMKVYSKNEKTGNVELKTVTLTHKNEVIKDMCKVYTKNGIVECTSNHNFYEKSKGWIGAKELKIGDILINSSKQEIQVQNIELIENDGNTKLTVYNLTIEDNYNYFVGYDKVLVHNLNCGSGNYVNY